MSIKNLPTPQLLQRLLHNKTSKNRWKYISILRSSPSQELFLECVKLTKAEDPKVRTIGIDILTQLGSSPRPFLRQTLDLFFDLLSRETDSKIVASLLFAVGHNNGELSNKQVEKLCAFSASKVNRVREAVVFSLLGVADKRAIETLINLSSDKIDHIRDWATFGIGTQSERNTKTIREALWQRVTDKHEETRLETYVGLAKRKDPRVIEILIRELQSGEAGTLLFEAISETRNKQFLPLLQLELEKLENDNAINPAYVEALEECINAFKNYPK